MLSYRSKIVAAASVAAISIACLCFRFSSSSPVAAAYAKWRPFEPRVRNAPHRRLGTGGMPRPIDQRDPDWLQSKLLLRGGQREPFSASAIVSGAYNDLWDGEVESAIERLRFGIALNGENFDNSSALGIGYFVRAARLDAPVDYARAADWFLKSLELVPGDPSSKFNLALSYERIGLLHQAESAWRNYLSLDPSSGWAGEAQSHLSETRAKVATAVRAAAIAELSDPANLDGLDSASIELGFVRLLPAAVARPGQNARLPVLAELLISRHADFWLRDALRQAPEHPRAYALLNDAIRSNRTGDYAAADAAGREALVSFANGGKAGRARANLEILYSLQRTAQTRQCLAFAQGVAAGGEVKEYPWIHAQILLFYGGCHYYSGQFAEGRAWLDEAAAIATAHHYAGLVDRASQFHSAWLLRRGDLGKTAAIAFRGLRRYWADGGPADYAQNHMGVLSAVAGQAQLSRFQAAASRERVAICQLMGNASAEAIAWVALGNANFQSGARGEARNAFQEAGRLLAKLPQRPDFDIFRLAVTTGLARADTASGDPARALSRLDEVGPSAAEITNATSITAFLGAKADAEAALGRTEQSERSSLAQVLLAQRGPGSDAVQDRIAWARVSAQGYRELARRMHERGDHRGSFHVWQSYLSAAVRRNGNQPPALGELLRYASGGAAPMGQSALPGQLLAFAVFEDGVLTWLVHGGNVESSWRAVSRPHLMKLISSLKAACSDPSTPLTSIQAPGRELYSILLSPLAGRLATASSLALQLDGPLRELPFQALTTPAGEYLGAEFAIEILDSALSSTKSAPRLASGTLRDLSALLVGSPMLHPDFAAAFPPLPDAAEEAGTIAAHFNQAALMTGAAATSQAITRALSSSAVFHFAGHAQGTTGGAVLMLASSGTGDRGIWRGNELKAGDLKSCSLAVFSACATAKAEDEFLSEPMNLVGTFLAAGAAQVVASGWRVDSLTSADMMKDLYRELASGRNVVDSLRAASAMVRRQAGRAHPYYWAPYAVYGTAVPGESEK